jgi:hypothetical protein
MPFAIILKSKLSALWEVIGLESISMNGKLDDVILPNPTDHVGG